MDHHPHIHTTIQPPPPPPSQQEQQPDEERHARTPYRTIHCYIPPYLQSYVYPCGTTTVTNTDDDDDDGDESTKDNGMVEEEEGDSDFCYTPYHQHPRLIAQLMMEGFLPMAHSNNRILLPKLHIRRCILYPLVHNNNNNATTSSSLSSSQPSSTQQPSHHVLHISKNVRKRSRQYAMTINQQFPLVVQECHRQHNHPIDNDINNNSGSGQCCWLYPSLVEILRTLHQATLDHIDGYITTTSSTTSSEPSQQISIRLYSIEVWNIRTNTLVAGELGYTVGNTIYTSLTGFSKEDSAGSVQLATLGALWTYHQFQLWDLGMDMPYKQRLGGHVVPRAKFVALVHQLRTLPSSSPSSSSSSSGHQTDAAALQSWKWPIRQQAQPINCRDIIDAILSSSSSSA
jgi:Leu/Phe-tRNA-protein transferase